MLCPQALAVVVGVSTAGAVVSPWPSLWRCELSWAILMSCEPRAAGQRRVLRDGGGGGVCSGPHPPVLVLVPVG